MSETKVAKVAQESKTDRLKDAIEYLEIKVRNLAYACAALGVHEVPAEPEPHGEPVEKTVTKLAVMLEEAPDEIAEQSKRIDELADKIRSLA